MQAEQLLAAVDVQAEQPIEQAFNYLKQSYQCNYY